MIINNRELELWGVRYNVKLKGENITRSVLVNRLVNLTVQGTVGEPRKASLSFIIDDLSWTKDPLFQEGVKMSISMGYPGLVINMGSFEVDLPKIKSPGTGAPSITLESRDEASSKAAKKEPEETISYEDMTYSEIAYEICERNRWRPLIEDTAKKIDKPISQATGETDIQFLKKLAKKIGFIVQLKHIEFGVLEKEAKSAAKKQKYELYFQSEKISKIINPKTKGILTLAHKMGPYLSNVTDMDFDVHGYAGKRNITGRGVQEKEGEIVKEKVSYKNRVWFTGEEKDLVKILEKRGQFAGSEGHKNIVYDKNDPEEIKKAAERAAFASQWNVTCNGTMPLLPILLEGSFFKLLCQGRFGYPGMYYVGEFKHSIATSGIKTNFGAMTVAGPVKDTVSKANRASKGSNRKTSGQSFEGTVFSTGHTEKWTKKKNGGYSIR
jgi:hypothetical protein